MKKLSTNVERYECGEGYILEVWEEVHPEAGVVYDFWIQQEGISHKLNIFSLPADQSQAKEPHVYTKEEAIELAASNVWDFLAQYDEEVAALDDFYESREPEDE